MGTNLDNFEEFGDPDFETRQREDSLQKDKVDSVHQPEIGEDIQAEEPVTETLIGEHSLSLDYFKSSIDFALNKILEVFEQKLMYDSTKQRQIDQLHAEVQKHQVDLIAKTNRPLVNGMISLHRDISNRLSSLQKRSVEELTPELFFRAFVEIQDDIEIILDQNGITTFSNPSEIFDPKRQQPIRKIETETKEVVGHISERLSVGFEQGDELIQKERVSVFVMTKKSD